ncbi:hypothetical protein GCM10009802_16590 [Streptomyces synnematoformans]|uniref:Uncharacterized protein n=1 Tax=Streptomyces synnematoformans TaxID=415721 RepID=A0ABN2XSH5_9ACTN
MDDPDMTPLRIREESSDGGVKAQVRAGVCEGRAGVACGLGEGRAEGRVVRAGVARSDLAGACRRLAPEG